MRTVSVSALLAIGLAVQQAAATGWTEAKTYKIPYNTNNQCTDKQAKGLPFDDLATGDLGFYGDLKWENTKCTNGLSKRTFGAAPSSFHGGEDSYSGNSKDFAGGKCASGTASKDINSSPGFSCGPNQKGMSINTMHISSSEDTDIELHYSYENGDVCKQPALCSKGGSVIKNSQCGGAKGVTVKLPDTDKKSNCEVGIHSVGFNCGPASSKPPMPTSAPIYSSPVVSTPVVSKPYPIPSANTTAPTIPPSGTAPATTPHTTPETTPISSTYNQTGFVPLPSTTVPQNASTPVYTTSAISTPETTPIASTTENSPTTPATTVPIVTTQVVYTTLTTCSITNTVTSGSTTSVETTSTVSTVFITSTSTVCTQCVPPPVSTPGVPVTTAPVPMSSSSNNSPENPTSPVPAPVPTTTQAIVTTEVVYTTLTTCPVTLVISGTTTSVQTLTTVSTITSTSVSTICTQCVPPPPPPVTTPVSSIGNSPVVPPSSPAISPPAPCPTVLPNCMKTWITLTTCKDNSDSNCYCQNADFTKSVQDCVSAWASSEEDVQGALSYLAGICAPHITKNPGIITNVPKTVILVPTPPASPAPATPIPVITSTPIVPGAPGNLPVGATSLPAAALPVTTISLSQTVTFPCPVSQVAEGQPQAPASSTCSSLLITQVIVPQVGFTTAPAAPGASSPSVGLAAGSPALVPASPTAGPGGNSPIGATTFGTVVGSASAIGSTKPPGSTGSIPFTGAASNVKATSFGTLAGVIGMLFFA